MLITTPGILHATLFLQLPVRPTARGIGRDGGDYSFDFYMETKNVCIALDTHGVPQLGKG